MKTPPHYKRKPMRRFVVRRARPSSRRTQGQKSLGGGQSGIAFPASGGGGGGDYVAKAVRFANASGLTFSNFAGANRTQILAAGSFKIDDISGFPTIFNTSAGFNPFQIAIGYSFNSDFTCSAVNSDGTKYFQWGSDDGLVETGRWNEFVVYADVGYASGAKIGQIVFNGVSVATHFDDNDSAFDGIGLDGSTIFFNNAGFAPACEWADFQLFSGVNGDLTNPDNPAKFFVAGKPIDPLEAAAAFGAPALLFQRTTADPLTFVPTGFSVVGDPPTNAASSPSD